MHSTALILSNDQTRLAEGSASLFEAMYPEQNSRWQFIALIDAADPAAALALPAKSTSPGEAPLGLLATPHGPRSGQAAEGASAIWVVLSNAVSGKDREFNQWYDSRHLHDVVNLPGMISGQRYTLAPMTAGCVMPWAYLAIFEIEESRVTDAFAALAVRRGGPRMPNPGYLAPDALLAAYRPVA